jgi:AcrR family transcriptional regulator
MAIAGGADRRVKMSAGKNHPPENVPPVQASRRAQALLRVACELFLEYGYERTSVDEIVRRAGGSKSGVYAAFGGKKELFQAAVQQLCRESNLALVRIDYRGLDLESSLRKFAVAFLRYILSPRFLALDRLIIAEAPRFPEIGQLWHSNGPEISRVYCAELLAAHLSPQESFLPFDRLAVCFHDLLLWDVQHRALAGMKITPAMIRQKVEDAVQLIVRALAFSPHASRKGAPAD